MLGLTAANFFDWRKGRAVDRLSDRRYARRVRAILRRLDPRNGEDVHRAVQIWESMLEYSLVLEQQRAISLLAPLVMLGVPTIPRGSMMRRPWFAYGDTCVLNTSMRIYFAAVEPMRGRLTRSSSAESIIDRYSEDDSGITSSTRSRRGVTFTGKDRRRHRYLLSFQGMRKDQTLIELVRQCTQGIRGSDVRTVYLTGNYFDARDMEGGGHAFSLRLTPPRKGEAGPVVVHRLFMNPEERRSGKDGRVLDTLLRGYFEQQEPYNAFKWEGMDYDRVCIIEHPGICMFVTAVQFFEGRAPAVKRFVGAYEAFMLKKAFHLMGEVFVRGVDENVLTVTDRMRDLLGDGDPSHADVDEE